MSYRNTYYRMIFYAVIVILLVGCVVACHTFRVTGVNIKVNKELSLAHAYRGKESGAVFYCKNKLETTPNGFFYVGGVYTDKATICLPKKHLTL